MAGKIVAGIASYDRPKAFHDCLRSLKKHKLITSLITACDASEKKTLNLYKEYLSAAERDLDVVKSISEERRGSVNARNWILEKATEECEPEDLMLLLDDDCLVPRKCGLDIVRSYFRPDFEIGAVGGRFVNLRNQKVDPDFYLNLFPGLADALTRTTGFVFLDNKHGPRLAENLEPLMVLPVEVLQKGIRYDSNFEGTGYREESDLQEQIKSLGYELIHEPRFHVYHRGLEYGGNRGQERFSERAYWKARNHAYFAKKHDHSELKRMLSFSILATYAAFHGYESLESTMEGFQCGNELMRCG